MDVPPLVLTGGSKVQGGTFGNIAVHSAFEIGLPDRIKLAQQHGQDQDYKRRCTTNCQHWYIPTYMKEHF